MRAQTVLVLGLVLPAAPGWALDLVVPNGALATPGEFGPSYPFDTASAPSLRHQQVYDAGEFPFPGPITIHSLAFRPWEDDAGAGVRDLEIHLSTTDAAPDAMSTVFDLNLGDDATLVFDDTIALSHADHTSDVRPFPFEIVIPLATPFAYDPAQGNLLVDIRNWTPAVFGIGALDQIDEMSDSISRVFTAQSATNPVGTADTRGHVTAFGITTPPHFIVPGAFAGAEAPGNNVLPLGTVSAPSLRYQQVYDASLLPFDGGVTIHSIAFRPDQTASPAAKVLDLAILLSSTAAAPDGLATTFDANLGPDVVVVFDGEIALATAVTPEGSSPKDFDVSIPLTTPFHYDPADGNLLLDLRNHTSGFFVFADTATAGDDGISRVVSRTSEPNLGSASSPTGEADTAGLVTRFGLPEASARGSGAAIALAIGALFARRRRGRLLLALPLLLAAPAPAHDLVVPNALVADDGGFNLHLFDTGTAPSLRHQQVYDANQFPFAEPVVIDSIAFRQGTAFAGSGVRDLEIWLSTTTAEVGALDVVFALNTGADAILVFDDAIALSAPMQGGDEPYPFHLVIPFETPFSYDPADGNLLVDVRNRSPEATGVPGLDFSLTDTAAVSRVGNSQSADAPTGTTGVGGYVTRFGVSGFGSVVAPGAFARAEAPAGNFFPFFTGFSPSARHQQLYDASLLPFDGAIEIHWIAFRPDQSADPGAETVDLAILMATTQAAPDTQSATFDDNLGPDVALVLNDEIALATAATPSGVGPNEFDVVIPLATPFVYDAAAGNLIVDVRTFTDTEFLFSDFVFASGAGVSRVFSQVSGGGTANSPAGTVAGGGAVTSFGLPEASAAGSTLAAVLALGALGRAAPRPTASGSSSAAWSRATSSAS